MRAAPSGSAVLRTRLFPTAAAASRTVAKSASNLDIAPLPRPHATARSEEHTSELQSLMRISYAVFCLKKKTIQKYIITIKAITQQLEIYITLHITCTIQKTRHTSNITNTL